MGADAKELRSRFDRLALFGNDPYGVPSDCFLDSPSFLIDHIDFARHAFLAFGSLWHSSAQASSRVNPITFRRLVRQISARPLNLVPVSMLQASRILFISNAF